MEKIHVIDYKPSGSRGSVVTLWSKGNIMHRYKGGPNISVKSRFKPVVMVTTLKDNVVLADMDTHTIHLLIMDIYLHISILMIWNTLSRFFLFHII